MKLKNMKNNFHLMHLSQIYLQLKTAKYLIECIPQNLQADMNTLDMSKNATQLMKDSQALV